MIRSIRATLFASSVGQRLLARRALRSRLRVLLVCCVPSPTACLLLPDAPYPLH